MDANDDFDDSGIQPQAAEIDDEVRSITDSPEYKRQSVRLTHSRRYSAQLIPRHSMQEHRVIPERSLADEKKLQEAYDEWIAE